MEDECSDGGYVVVTKEGIPNTEEAIAQGCQNEGTYTDWFLRMIGLNSSSEDELIIIKKEMETLNKLNKELAVQNDRLQKDKEDLEREKQEALSRLSKMVSARLCDNNPNIADLSDLFRPTKLAEMFSELYDNEWTDAFTYLEKEHDEICIIEFLLDIIMEVFLYCEKEIEQCWNFISQWFLSKDAGNTEEIRKSLKDGLKRNIFRQQEDLKKKYMHLRATSHEIEGKIPDTVMSRPELQAYVTQCLKLCLPMCATDPPVVIYCPTIKGFGKNDCDQRILMDKDRFREYTQRGKYLQYVVWPAMYLHKDGPLLAKGVAQGTNE